MHPKNTHAWFKTVALWLLLIALPALAVADIKKTIAALAPSGLVLVLDEQGMPLVAQRPDDRFSPASVSKIVTAWLALEVLGKDYRFKTPFYLDSQRTLYVRGAGDPFLVSEELAVLAQNLIAKTGKAPFTGLVVDTDYYPSDLRIPGIKNDNAAYNAGNAALAANFNTIHAVRRGKSVRSAEKQTPITPLAISQFRSRGPKGRGRINLSQKDPALSARYAGELIAAFIRTAGGSVKGSVRIGPVPQTLQPVYTHTQSRDLPEILRQMLLGSNNYVANQIFLEIGAHRSGGPVSLDKSIKVAAEILANHDLDGQLTIKEGSGISPMNRFTARGLATVLHHFAPNAALLVKTRKGSRYKTGSIPGVRTLAGYAATTRHGRVRFVISLGGKTGRLRFRLLQALERGL